MVFESIVVEVLNKILGDYIENLDRKQLSIGIWGGDVVLQNLVLRQSALEDLDLPVQTVYGQLGKLVLKIPWKNLYGAPVEASVERLYLLVVPNQEVKYDPTKEEKYEQDTKVAGLKRIEEAQKKAEEQGKKKVDDTFVEKLTTQIIKNVQVKIKDIHVRYEDSVTNPEKPFALGFTLSNLSVETTDDQWKAAIVSDMISKIYKVLNLDALAVYWNCNCDLYSKLNSADILRYFEDNIATREFKPADYTYILGPINSSARLRMNPKPENDDEPFSTSKILLNLEMEKLAVGLIKSQFQDIMALVDSMQRMSRGIPYRKYRPFVKTYKGHYKEWWKFAYTCILETEVRRRRRNWDWTHICRHRALCKNYAEAYQTKLQNKKVPTEVEKTLEQGEKTLDLFNLVIIRQRIEMEVKRLNIIAEEKHKNASWFSGWWGKPATDEDKEIQTAADIMKKFEKAMTADEKSKLYSAIDYQENSAPAEYPQTFIATNCAFVLRSLEIEIRDDLMNMFRVLNVELKGVNCRLLQRPAASAIQAAVKIDQFTIFGVQQGDVIPQLVSSEDFSEGETLLDVLFETNPIDKKCDQRLHVRSNPLKVIFDAQTIIKIQDIFKVPEAIGLDELQAAAGSKFADLKERSATGMQHAIDKQPNMDLDIKLSAPYIIVPHGGLYSPSKAVIVINLGNMSIKSVPRTSSALNVRKMFKEGTTETDIIKEMLSQSYDNFILELSDLQVLIANENEEWRKCISENTVTSMHIVQPINCTVRISKCLVTDDPRLPKIKIAGELPSIALNVSDDRVVSLLGLVTSIPFSNDDEVQIDDLGRSLSRSSSISSMYSVSMAALTKTMDKNPVRPKSVAPVDDSNFTQLTNLEVKFDMKELVVLVSSKDNDELKKVIQFSCHMFELEMVQQTFNIDVVVRLGSVRLTQFRELGQLQIINTPQPKQHDQYLFIVQFYQVNTKSPEFHSKHGSCEQRLQLTFTSLQLQLHQEGLQEILKFADTFQKSLENIKKKSPEKERALTVRVKRNLSIIEENVSKKVSKRNVAIKKSTRMIIETIMFKLAANLGELDVLMANDARQLANFAVKGIKAEIIMKKSYTQIMATLTDIIVLDPNPQSIHSQIICRTGVENAIDAQILLYNVKGSDDVDISIGVTMSCLRITFLNLFTSSILDFLNKFQQAQEKIKEASAAAAETARMNMQNAYENATRIKMNINIEAPVIIVPVNSTSYDGIMLDLGNVKLTNRFNSLEVADEDDHTAVVDELSLRLKDLKLSRILLDSHLKKIVECMLLKPLSFSLNIKRNLSASWYNNIPDLDIAGEMGTIELMISEADYGKIMQVLSENLTEKCPGAAEAPAKPSQANVRTNLVVESRKSQRQSVRSSMEIISKFAQEKQPHSFLRFKFTMQSLIINLFKGGSKSFDAELDWSAMNHAPKDGLAQFTLMVFSLKGRIMTDNSITTSILLLDCLLDDTRIDRESKLTRLMERKKDQVVNFAKSGPSTESITRSMIDLTFQQKDNDKFVDIRVYSFNLILSIDYLLKIAAFFSPQEGTPKKPVQPVKPKVEPRSEKSQMILAEAGESNITLNLKVEKPDIILVERMDNLDTRALILNTEVLLNVRLAGENKSIRGSINDLQLYVCCFNPEKRDDTKCHLLRPCNIVVVGTTPLNQGLHLDVTLSEIRISVSPAIIELLSTIQSTMNATDVRTAGEGPAIVYYSHLWDAKSFKDSDFWFLKTEEGQDAMEAIGGGTSNVVQERQVILKEICNVSITSISVSIEAGVSNKTLPFLLLETSFQAVVHDWSSKLHIDGTLTVQMAYYNSRLAVWEPLIEPVEVTKGNRVTYAPWELKVEMCKNDQEDQYVMSPQSENESIEEISFSQPSLCMHVFSSVNLEVVITKTLLDVLANLGKAFQDAYKVGIPAKEPDMAPYRVINDTGLKVIIILQDSIFQLYGKKKEENYGEILLESGTEVQLELTVTEEKQITIAKSVSSYSNLFAIQEKSFLVSVKDMKCTLKIPVERADKRYFPLNYRGENKDNWGLVSDITVEAAETIITLRSMLQVHNHFHHPVNIYYMTNRGNELEIIKEIPPDTSCNLPLQAVYTLTNELFFSVKGHCVSVAPFVWKDLQHNLCLNKTLTCPAESKNTARPFVMKACGDIEQIFFENTTKHTMVSTCYNIHLKPAVIFKNCLPVPVICVTDGSVDEFNVQPGEQLHMPTIIPGSSGIVIRLVNYLEKEWSCKHEIASPPPEFSVWSFESHDSSVKMGIDLGMHCVNKNGSIILSLYCPFWMLNKTGLMLSYRNSDANVNVLHHPEDYKQPILFSFNAKNFFGKKKASFRIETGEWSDKFSLDVAGSSGTVVCKANNMIYQIGVHNQLTYNGLTKQVTFTPFFVLMNNAPFIIECQELERPADPWIIVEPNSCTPLWPHSERDDKLLKIRIGGTTELSAPFLITEVHTILLKLPNKYGGVNVDVQVTEGGNIVTFTEYQPGLAPVLIINHTQQTINLWEKESVNVKHLQPRLQILHTWENPTGPRLLIWETGKRKELEDDLRKDGLGEFSLDKDAKIYWVSFLDGMQRVLLFTEDMAIARDAQSAGDLELIDKEITISIHGIGLSLINNLIGQEIMYIGIASSGIIWEICKVNSKRYKPLNLRECTLIEAAYQQYLHSEEDLGPITVDPKIVIDFKNEMMLRPQKRHLRRAFQTGLWVQQKTSPNQMQLHAKINRVQIDNQMYDCIFPVILAPVPLPKSVAASCVLKPFVELSIVQRIMTHSSVKQYKYFKVLIQEFHIKVDLGFVNALLPVFQAKNPSENDEKELFIKDMGLVNEPLMSLVSTQSQLEQKNFYDLLHFSPLKIHISFSLAAPSSTGSTGNATTANVPQSSTPEFLNVLLQGLGVTLTDMQDVVFRLAYFEREYSFLTQKQLTSEATSHYVGQAVKQLYVLVLGLDVIGNPYGLVLGISKGVEDLFYEPFQGAIQGPGEFAEGLVLGVRSLFGHTVGGAAGAVSRITGAMGKGIAALTFDKDYQTKRRNQINKKPANIQEGIARGGKGLVMGVVDGVTGVFTKPFSGAKEQGVEGFFKGLGKGAVGLVTRPTAGVIDFASGSLDAVKRAAEMGDDVHRLRAPRYMRADGLVRPYIQQEAEGYKLLRELEKGKYASTDVYAFHMWIIEKKDILLLTDKRMAYVIHNDIFGGWQVEWSYTWTELNVPAKVVDKGVQIQAGEAKKKVLGFFGSQDNGKIIIIPNPEMREIVKNKIETLRQNA